MARRIISGFFQSIQKQFGSIQMFTMSVCSALVLAISVVTIFQNGNGNSMMASIDNLNNNSSITEHFSANIILENSEKFSLKLGVDLENVEKIEGIIALNPDSGVEIISENNIVKISDGIYRFSLNFQNEMLKK